MQESLLQQENSLGRGYSEVLAELGARAAQQPVLLPGQLPDKRIWDSPDILGKLDAMCAPCLHTPSSTSVTHLQHISIAVLQISALGSDCTIAPA